jgi:hypothetical protein
VIWRLGERRVKPLLRFTRLFTSKTIAPRAALTPGREAGLAARNSPARVRLLDGLPRLIVLSVATLEHSLLSRHVQSADGVLPPRRASHRARDRRDGASARPGRVVGQQYRRGLEGKRGSAASSRPSLPGGR